MRTLVDIRLIYDAVPLDKVLPDAFLTADFQAGRVDEGSPDISPDDAYVLRITHEADR